MALFRSVHHPVLIRGLADNPFKQPREMLRIFESEFVGNLADRLARVEHPFLGQVDQLHLENVIFTGRVDIISYMEKLDFTILTSISEGQPLSVLESFAARRPCVTTDVGCCRELLNGNEEDRYGTAGYCWQ